MPAKQQKKTSVLVLIMVLLCLVVAVCVWAIRGGGRTFISTLPGNLPPAETKTRVAFSEQTAVGGLAIRLLPEPADDGNLVYKVQNSQGAALGTFKYIPWQGKNPLYQQLPGGDVILGNSSIVAARDHLMHPLADGTGLGYIFDYSVSGSRLALVGKSSQDGDTRIYICIRDLTAGGCTQVDSFKYPDYLSMKQAYLCWAGGKLYYDYCLGDKPDVKVYDPAANQSTVYKDNAMGPQASPDGHYLTLFASDAPGAKSGTNMGLELIDLESSRVNGLEGSNRIFWSSSYVTVWDGDKLQLHIYDLSGNKLRDVPSENPVADLIIDNGVLSSTMYQFDNKQITRKQFQAELKLNNEAKSKSTAQ